MKAWLYKDFWWWFSGWVLLLVISLFIYSYNADIGGMLLKFSGTILVALLTAMAAFDHMNTNERRKTAREHYIDFSGLLVALDERYQNVMTLRENYKELFDKDAFMRGLTPPFSIIRDVNKAPDLHKLNFLKKKYQHIGIGDLSSLRQSAFNTANINTILSNYDYLMKIVGVRNDIYKASISDIIDQYYSGNGSTYISAETLCKNGLSYARLTNFLMITEQIMSLTDGLYHELRNAIDELNEGCKQVLDSEIAKENFGYPNLKYSFENDELQYKELSIVEMQKMHQRTYSSNRDYRQRFF